MKILMASSEAVPYVKTGGLADVTGSLVKELRKRHERTSLILPLYTAIKRDFELYKTDISFSITLGDVTEVAHLWASEKSPNPQCYFIECDNFYSRDELYGTSDGDYHDNALRFIFFSRAVLEACLAMNLIPDVLHCNDWQTAMIPLFLRTLYKDNTALKSIPVLFTIHNLGYAGLFPSSDLKYTGLSWDYFTSQRLEFYGKLNFMKAGILYADLLSTVSRTYAREILEKEYGFGLEGVLGMRKHDIYGVTNGIDYAAWDPAHDEFIHERFRVANTRGKVQCKLYLLKKTGLENKELPLISVVSRLSWQKGMDLIIRSIDEIVSLGCNVIVLGKGDDKYQKVLAKISETYRGRVFVRIGFEEAFAHQIYAGSDFFLMPSRYEPCGLSQLIAMKYGSLPIARKTGGLADTIRDYDHLSAKGTGFLFSEFTPSSLQSAVKRALCVYTTRMRMNNMITEAMRSDFSWSNSAAQYLDLYKKAIEKVR